MKKLFTFLVVFLVGQSLLAQYHYLPFPEAKSNPGGLNVDAEGPFSSTAPNGWKQIHVGSNNTPTWSPTQSIPFAFTFNGKNVANFKVSSSGVLTFDANSTKAAPAYTPETLPNAALPDSSVCAWGLSGIGSNDLILSKTFGKAPNRQFWIQFNSYGYGTVASDGSNFTYWGIVLEETTNTIYVVDQRTGGYAKADLLTVGVQVDNKTAVMVAGSPALGSLTTTDATSSDNAYYAFRFGAQPAYNMSATDISTPIFAVLGDNVIDGTLRNLGTETVTSYDINYKVDAGAVVTSKITGVNIAKFDKANFSHPIKWNATSGSHVVTAWASNINGKADEYPADDKFTKNIFVVTTKVKRKPLYEIFTSSTCGPCAPGNTNFHKIVDAKPAEDFVAIKFQQDFPGTGDPYCTTEAVNRRSFYSITSIPRMEIDGGWNSNAQAFTEGLYNSSTNSNAQFVLSGTYSLDSVTMTAKINYKPLFDVTSAKLYVAIIENQTTKNVKTNGEKTFEQVMKKMLPTEAGTTLTNIPEGKSDSITLSYKFIGKYRLPIDGAAANRITHTKEHSVEEFSDLRMIAWVQSTGQDKQVYQAVNLSKKTSVGNEDLPLSVKDISVFPNPASDFINIALNAEKQDKITLLLISADGNVSRVIEQTVDAGANKLQINTSELASGMYYLSIIDAKNNSHTQGIMIAK
jgi:Secretion system C-terminal sorting domain